MHQIGYYLFILVAIMVAVFIIKKVASCMVRSVVGIVLIVLLVYIYYMYLR